MRCITDAPAETFKGKRVLVRSDFNLPLDANGAVADRFRLTRGWETISYLANFGARVIITSHIGRNPEASLEPVALAAKELSPVIFIADITGPVARGATSAMRDGEIVMLENLRRDPREKANDESFAQELAALADIYVDDAFAAAHRAHASIVGVPKLLPHYAGILMNDEVAHLQRAMQPVSPSIAILGGAKFETKAPLIKSLLATYDHLFIVGALANDILKAQGFPVGRSLISKEVPSTAVLNHPHLLVPVDVTVLREDGQACVRKPAEVEEGDTILDIGPDSVAYVAPFMRDAKFVLWNGPTGMYEKGYVHYTGAIAELLNESSAEKIIGGGDTIAAIEVSGVPQKNLGFLSTGGGAMLEYLLKGSLLGVEALR